MKNRFRLLLLLLAIAITGVACGVEMNSLFGPAAGRSAEESQPLLTDDSTGAPNSEKQFTISPASANSGLDQLASYRANLILDFEGTRSGERSAGHIESLVEVNRQPLALHQYVNIDGGIPNTGYTSGVSEFYRVGNKIYTKKIEELSWFELEADAQTSPGALGFLELEKLIVLPRAVSNAPYLETLSGLTAWRYGFTEDDLVAPNLVFKQAQGELWVATDGNYVVRYVISASLRMPAPIPNAHILDEGRLNLRYTLTDINADLSITPPEGIVTSPTLLAELPRLPDAELTTVLPTLIEYTSVISPISATLFYREELSALEWSEDKATIFNEKSSLIFSKEDQVLTIIITPIDDPNKIKVVLVINDQ